MKLRNLSANSKNSEVNAVTGRISDNYHQTLAGEAILSPVIAEIDTKNSELTIAVKRMKAESDLEEKDEIRDTAHHALYHFVYGLSFSKNVPVKNSASKLFVVLEHYGLSIIEENYDTETSELDSLLIDLAAPNLKSAIAALDTCDELIADLQLAQDDFKTSRLSFQKEQAGQKQKSNATVLKREVLALVNSKLLRVLNGLLISNPAVYTDFGATVAKIINTNNETIKQRKNDKAGDTGDE
ncbi:MAG: DUF6261 family protein [Mangrovibacterium sp.]